MAKAVTEEEEPANLVKQEIELDDYNIVDSNIGGIKLDIKSDCDIKNETLDCELNCENGTNHVMFCDNGESSDFTFIDIKQESSNTLPNIIDCDFEDSSNSIVVNGDGKECTKTETAAGDEHKQRTFVNADDYLKDLIPDSNETETLGKYSCIKCSESFIHKVNYLRHLAVHSFEKVHTCPICNKSYVKLNRFNMHFKKHISENINSKACSSKLRFPNQITVHSKKTFQRNPCPNPFMRKADIMVNVSVCSGKKQHMHDKCGTSKKQHMHNKRGASKPSLVPHYLRHNRKKYNCEKCNNRFSVKREYDFHVRLHSEESKFHHCKICNRCFVRKYEFTKHTECHVDKKHKCLKCGERFIYKVHLYQHMESHACHNICD